MEPFHVQYQKYNLQFSFIESVGITQVYFKSSTFSKVFQGYVPTETSVRNVERLVWKNIVFSALTGKQEIGFDQQSWINLTAGELL